MHQYLDKSVNKISTEVTCQQMQSLKTNEPKMKMWNLTTYWHVLLKCLQLWRYILPIK